MDKSMAGRLLRHLPRNVGLDDDVKRASGKALSGCRL
jgi:hypothetical protein